MKSIFKYKIEVANKEFGIQVPVGAKAISAQMDMFSKYPAIYYVFDTDNQFTTEMRRVIAVYTGAVFREEGTFIGTLKDEVNALVYHVFELA